MEDLISLRNLIKEARLRKIDLGKGDPYNRLRYYTKIGWLPHMTRKINKKGIIEGHYPTSVLDVIEQVQLFKDQGVSNEEIEKRIKSQNTIKKINQTFSKFIPQKKHLFIGLGIFFLIVVFTEINLIRIGKPKTIDQFIKSANSPINIQLIDSGEAILTKGTKEITVNSEKIKTNSRVNVTFRDDYTPASRYWIGKIKDSEGFELKLDAPVSKDVDFYWFIAE